ncbi:hypothetical protein GFB56_32785 [Ensifer sp. T173]|uniref:Uncharacterized protein n=1 Tax=Ensifer canadensis TaxID=555315 RepID=A0AAW4FVQ4_9HYPH|nr:hypothetical protein [Ensifer canadensis]MBM3095500.1 hypothetical protein [Ensifer canadensis]UBI79098.1 hypothetical protein J3R84_23650 [Ensifer canadensis]
MQEPVNHAAGPDLYLFVGARPESFASGGGADEVLLLQPDPTVAAKLERAIEGQAGVRVIAASLGKAAGQATLNMMNMAALSSLRQPTPALLDLFPGLKTVATRDVRILRVADLDIPIAIDGLPYSLRVQIDMPGSEFDILSCLDETGLLAKVTECIVLCGTDVFFEGGCNYQAVVDFLAEKAFVQTDRDDSDPDWPVLRFRGNPQSRQAMLARISSLENELTELKETADKSRILFGELEAERNKLRQQVAAHTEAAKVLEATAEERKKRIGVLEVENKRTVELQADVGFQIRMNALLRNDLDELAGRFEQSERQRLRLEELLRTLTPKLQQAAEELHLLQASPLSKAKMVEVAGGKPKTKRGRRDRNA